MLYVKNQIGEGIEVFFKVEELIAHQKTEYQEILIFDNPDGERCLFIDGEEQSNSSYADAFNQSFFRHVPDMSIGVKALGDVLIIGAGAGGPAKFALKYGAKSVEQIDIDGDMITLAKEHLGEWHEGSFDDKRVSTHVISLETWLENKYYQYTRVGHQPYDTVICDLTFDTTNSSDMWSRDTMDTLFHMVKPGGTFATHVGWIGGDPAERVALFDKFDCQQRHLTPSPEARWWFFTMTGCHSRLLP